MEQKKFITLISVLLIFTFLAACSSRSDNTPTQAVQTTETQISQATALQPATQPATEAAATEATEPPVTSEGAGMPVAGQGLCANAYYPAREGATWTYMSTGGPAGEYSFTDTITSVRDDGFTLSTQIGTQTRTQDWNCTQEGLVALQLGGAPAAMLNSQNIQLNLNAKNVNGVTFPDQINVGDKWQQSMDVDGNVSMGNEGGAATGKAQMNFSALGNESVTVPAGTFDTMKIQVDVTLDTNVKYGLLSLPVPFSGSYTYWFVQGVGWVKATGTGKLMGSSFSETTEMQSYKIP